MFRNANASFVAVAAVLLSAGERANAQFVVGEPTNLGPVVNSLLNDSGSDISADGLSLYFASFRSGTLGSSDLWVTTRASVVDPWGAPVNLGGTGFPVVTSSNSYLRLSDNACTAASAIKLLIAV